MEGSFTISYRDADGLNQRNRKKDHQIRVFKGTEQTKHTQNATKDAADHQENIETKDAVITNNSLSLHHLRRGKGAWVDLWGRHDLAGHLQGNHVAAGGCEMQGMQCGGS